MTPEEAEIASALRALSERDRPEGIPPLWRIQMIAEARQEARHLAGVRIVQRVLLIVALALVATVAVVAPPELPLALSRAIPYALGIIALTCGWRLFESVLEA